jgi:hypothetical protein
VILFPADFADFRRWINTHGAPCPLLVELPGDGIQPKEFPNLNLRNLRTKTFEDDQRDL